MSRRSLGISVSHVHIRGIYALFGLSCSEIDSPLVHLSEHITSILAVLVVKFLVCKFNDYLAVEFILSLISMGHVCWISYYLYSQISKLQFRL